MSHDEDVEDGVRAGLAKLNKMIEDDEMVLFAKDEAEALREVASWWLALKGTGKIGGLLYSALKWAIGAAALIAVARAGLLEYLSEALGGPK